MSAPDAPLFVPSPIRHLICPDIERPLATETVSVDRRKCNRYARRLPAILTCQARCYRVLCRDIAYGGACVESTEPLELADGDKATLSITLGHRMFADKLVVTARENRGAVTVCHLKL